MCIEKKNQIYIKSLCPEQSIFSVCNSGFLILKFLRDLSVMPTVM